MNLLKGINRYYITLIFILTLLFIVGNSIFSFQKIQSIYDNERLVDHTHEVIYALNDTLIAILNTETSQRGYIINPENDFLATYNKYVPIVHQRILDVKRLTKDNHRQQKSISILEQDINQRLVLLQQGIDIRNNQGIDAAQAYIAARDGKKKMEEIRNLISAMKQEEQTLLVSRVQQAHNSYMQIYTTVTISGFLNIALISLAYFLIIRELRRRNELEVRKDEFISMASHELKTPLTSMKIFAQILSKELDKTKMENAKKYVKKINEQTQKLHMLVTDLLDISRIQTEKLRFETTKIDLYKIIVDTVESLQATTRKHTIVCKGPANIEIIGDRYRIYQVLTNLLTNAIKYSPKGGKILVRLKSEKNNAVISVKDYGIGIDKAHINKVFDRLYQVNDPNAEKVPGLGIGLYVSSEIVRRHGGKIWVESTKGKGSTFYFTLPIDPQKYKRLISPVRSVTINS